MTEPLLQCIVGRDGHALLIALAPEAEFELHLNLLVLAEVGFSGYELARMAPADAFASYEASQSCEACEDLFPCGCRIRQVRAGECPHGSLGVIALANKRVRARLN